MPTTIGALLAGARPRLAAAPFRPSTREGALLLGAVLGLSEAQVFARPGAEVADAAAARFEEMLRRRLTGEPVSYLFGEREFYGRPFHVDSRVLIPRPETEHVVESALALHPPRGAWLLDVGTGSGCLAVTLALEILESRVVATDISPAALAVAQGNARRLRASDRVHLLAADLAAGLDLGRFDLAVSNPPYIDRAEAPALSPEVCNFEPHLALFSPGAGDSTLARLCGTASGLRPGAHLVVEIGFGQFDAARRHAAAAGLELAGVRRDYSGIPRVLTLKRP